MASFELDRRSVAGGAVAPLGVVEHLDVVEDVGAGVHQSLARAKRTAAELQLRPMEVIPGLVQKIHIHRDRLVVMLNPDGITLTVPMQLKRCGMAMKLVMAASGKEPQAAPDGKLIALLAKAHDWARRLTTGSATGVLEIAEQEGVGSSYVNRIVHLAFLAPSIVEAIGQGRQPPELNTVSLIANVPLPLDWAEQRRVLGFAS